jgi:hypothetical protein
MCCFLNIILRHYIFLLSSGECLTTANMGQKWYQMIGYDLPLIRWTFFFKFRF